MPQIFIGSSDEGLGAPLKRSWQKVPQADLPTPNGATLGSIAPSDLLAKLTEWGVPGVSAELGHLALAELYAKHLASLHLAAGDKEVAAWLAERKS